jgi:hypothetical protein
VQGFGTVKWTRAVHHLDTLARTCAEMATRPSSIFPLRVAQLWAVGDILGAERDIETVTVALTVDLPVDDVPWLSEPSGSQHWSAAARLIKSPVVPFWRSTRAAVWNHRIARPALIWDAATGPAEDTIAAIGAGRAEPCRTAAPTVDEFDARMADELRVSLLALRAHTSTYEDRRWRPGKLEPVADTLWRASAGYLDVLDAVRNGQTPSTC